jgi:hypothetical protein
MAGMSLSRSRLTQLILDQLARREMRLLALIVAVRREVGRSEVIKGDLAESVKATLRQLVVSRAIVDVEGTYALS